MCIRDRNYNQGNSYRGNNYRGNNYGQRNNYRNGGNQGGGDRRNQEYRPQVNYTMANSQRPYPPNLPTYMYYPQQTQGNQSNTTNSQPISGNPEVRQEPQTSQQPNVLGDRANETVAHLN